MTKTDWTSADYREASKRLAMGDILLPVSQVRSMLDFAANRIASDEAAVPVAYLAENANEAFVFFANDHESLDAYTADGFSITCLVRGLTQEAEQSHQPAQAAQVDPLDTAVGWLDMCKGSVGDIVERLTAEPVAQPSPNAADSGRVLNVSDEMLRFEWIKAGGAVHGPCTETVTMSEAAYFKFRRELIADYCALAAQGRGDVGVGVDSTIEGAHVCVRLGNAVVYSHFHPAPPASPAVVPDWWRETFIELLEDYAGSRAETAVWNVTQRAQPEGGIRMPRPRLAKLMAHVDVLAAPSHGESA